MTIAGNRPAIKQNKLFLPNKNSTTNTSSRFQHPKLGVKQFSFANVSANYQSFIVSRIHERDTKEKKTVDNQVEQLSN